MLQFREGLTESETWVLPPIHLRDLAHVHELAEASFALRHVDAAEACRLARLAVRRAEAASGGRDTADARALAWAHLGNALKISNNLSGAEAAISSAQRYLLEGTGAQALRAEISEFAGSIYWQLRRFGEARLALEEALEVREETNDWQAVARCLVLLASVIADCGEPESAVPLLCRALYTIDPMAEPELAHGALHNLCWILVDLGEPMMAQEIILEQEAKGLVCLDPLLALRRRWLLARLAGGLGGVDIACCELSEIRDAFIELNQPLDAAIAALELALLYAEKQDLGRVEAVLVGVLSIFSCLGIQREAAAAILLEDALRFTATAREVVPRVIGALRRDPGVLRVSGAPVVAI